MADSIEVKESTGTMADSIEVKESTGTMADSIEVKESKCTTDHGQTSCLSSSSISVDHILTDTSNLSKESKSSSNEELPVKQKEPDVKQESSTPTLVKKIEKVEQKNDFEIGDIVWAKIGRYPFWPSIVCQDPETLVHIKGSLKDKRKFSLHVRFFNDNGRRSWAKTVERFSGKDKFLSKYPNCLSFFKNNQYELAIWNLAAWEADDLLFYNRQDRFPKFVKSYKLSTSKISGLGPTPSTSKTSVVGKQVASTSKGYVNLNPMDYLRKMMSLCVEGSKVTYDPKCEEIAIAKRDSQEPKKKPVKRKRVVDEKKKLLREALKKKKAKRAMQVKKYGFSYSSSEYESTDDEAVPLVPSNNPDHKVPQRIKDDVYRLEKDNMEEIKKKRAMIKAIRASEGRSGSKKKNKEEEEEEEEEQ